MAENLVEDQKVKKEKKEWDDEPNPIRTDNLSIWSRWNTVSWLANQPAFLGEYSQRATVAP